MTGCAMLVYVNGLFDVACWGVWVAFEGYFQNVFEGTHCEWRSLESKAERID